MSSDSTSADAADDAGDDPGLATRAYRTVTPSFLPHPDAEMDVVGWGLFLGTLLLLVPLLPLIVVVWLVSKVVEALAPSG